ncbi:MAG TPA: diguanylate cyclase [Solirubrobacteraceae bacterium]|nr:diguanylate cyclase [Solirubrobacteraceae bacterium]
MSEPDAFRGVLDALTEGVYLVDRSRKIRFWNRACEEISGYSAAEVVGHHCFENILRHVDDTGTQLCRIRCPLASTMHDGQNRHCGLWLHHKDGRRLPVQVHTTPIRNSESRIIGAFEIFTDQSALTSAQERAALLERQALTDPLTGLPNRRYLDLALPAAIADARRHGDRLAVAFIDIDNFKAVNDAHGHEIGDRLLQMVAGTLAANLRTSDIICRYGGEEFVTILPHMDPGQLSKTCERLLALVRTSSLDRAGGPPLSVTISLGAVIASLADTFETVLTRADDNLYTSKRLGRNRVTI